MSEISETYRHRADLFEAKVAAVKLVQWSNQSPCDEWTARDVVGHIIDMHGVMLRGLDREPTQAPALADDPRGAWRAARADMERLLDDHEFAARVVDTPGGRMTVEQHVDDVASMDLVLHGWDLAKATGQDATIDPNEVEKLWPALSDLPEEMYIPEAFGPGIVVFGPKVDVPEDAPTQDRLLGAIGRDPNFQP